jgi:flagellar basal body-associated protein FliL
MSTPPPEPAAPEALITELALPRLQVNVADASGTRYAQLDIMVEVTDPAMLPLFAEPDARNPKGRQKRIMATIINIVSDKPITALLSAEGKRQLATEIKDTLNDMLAKENAGNVLDVYFSGFLVQ